MFWVTTIATDLTTHNFGRFPYPEDLSAARTNSPHIN
jgi:hypothetical protein